MSTDLAIGIDLGTSNSCVSVFRNGCVEIIHNDQGTLNTPSFVTFTAKRGRFVGEEAKNNSIFEPENTIFDAKRLLGRKYNDKNLNEIIKHWQFNVVEEASMPKILIDVTGKARTYCPEEMSSMVLLKMKEIADAYLKMEVKKCVIGVPAYFNDRQRQAIIDAGKIAGFDVLRIINEPTAVAIAYSFTRNVEEAINVLVYDLGGGIFNASIFNIHGKSVKTLSTSGNTHLGGRDFDNRLIDYVIGEFEDKHGIKIENNKRALKRIHLACEKAKTTLSLAKKTSVEIDYIIDGFDMKVDITREKFEDLNVDLFESTLAIVEDCLREASLTKTKIDEIVLVGGSTRIPKIRSIVQKYFDDREFNTSINPYEAVAHGAAIVAALQNTSMELEDVSFVDITPMSLGVNSNDGPIDNIVKRNTQIPLKITRSYSTTIDDQSEIEIIVLESDSDFIKDNKMLAKFIIKGFPIKEKGMIEICATFEMDDNGILTVDCKESSSSNTSLNVIKLDDGRLSIEDIQRMKDESKIAYEEQTLCKQISEEKNNIYEYWFEMENELSEDNTESALSSDVRKSIIKKCTEIIEWIDQNPDETLPKYQSKYQEIKQICDDYLFKDTNEFFCDKSSNNADEDEQACPEQITSIKNVIYEYCHDTKLEIPNHISLSIKKKIDQKLDETVEWLDNNKSLKLELYESKLDEIKKFYDDHLIDGPEEFDCESIPIDEEENRQTNSELIAKARNKIYNYSYDIKQKFSSDIPTTTRKKIIKKCDETKEWINKNNSERLNRYESLFEELKQFCDDQLINKTEESTSENSSKNSRENKRSPIDLIANLRNELYEYCHDTKLEIPKHIPLSIKRKIVQKFDETVEWLDNNESLKLELYESKLDEIKKFYDDHLIDDPEEFACESIPIDEEENRQTNFELIAKARNKIYYYSYDIKQKFSSDIPTTTRKKIIKKCDETIQWINKNNSERLNRYESLFEELKQFCDDQLINKTEESTSENSSKNSRENKRSPIDLIANLRNELYEYCHDTKLEIPKHIPLSIKRKIVQKFDETVEWLDNNESLKMELYESKFDEIKKFYLDHLIDDPEELACESIPIDEEENRQTNFDLIVKERNKIYNYSYDIKQKIPAHFPSPVKKSIFNKCRDIEDWINKNKSERLERYESLFKELKQFCDGIIGDSETDKCIADKQPDLILKVKNDIYKYCNNIKLKISSNITLNTKKKIFEKCDEIVNWVKCNDSEKLEKYESKFTELKTFYNDHLNEDFTCEAVENNSDEQELLHRIGNEKNKIFEFCQDMKEGIAGDIPLSIRKMVHKKCEEAVEWVNNNKNENLEKYQQKFKEIKSFCDKHL